MPHLESFFGKQKTRKAEEEGEAEEAEQETSEQRRENKMQREKHARERKRRTHGQEIEGATKEGQTQRERGSANHPEKVVPQLEQFYAKRFPGHWKTKHECFPFWSKPFIAQSGNVTQLRNNINGQTNNQADADNT